MRFVKSILFSIIASTTLLVFGDWDPKYYEANSEIQYNWPQQVFAQLDLQGDEAVLDLGCGNGKLLEGTIAPAVPNGRVVGLDSNAKMIKYAHDVHNSKGNITYVIGDSRALEYNDEFDLVTAFSHLHWIEDKDAVIRSAYAALKSGGRGCFYFGPDFGENRLDHAIEFVAKQERWPAEVQAIGSGFAVIKLQDFHDMLTKNGFTVEHFQPLKTHDTFKCSACIKKWMKAWLPHLKHLDDEQKDVFLTAIVDEYLTHWPADEDGTVHYYDHMLEVIVRK